MRNKTRRTRNNLTDFQRYFRYEREISHYNDITAKYFPVDEAIEELYAHSTKLVSFNSLVSFDSDDEVPKFYYTFSVPKDISSDYQNPTELISDHKSYARTSLTHWQSYINAEFVEINPTQNINFPDIRIFQAELNMSNIKLDIQGGELNIQNIPAMTKQFQLFGNLLRYEVCFDYRIFYKYDDRVLIKYTTTHELGHALSGLIKHPFEILAERSYYDSSTLYSVLNYRIDELYKEDGDKLISFPVLPTTPMLADIELIQEIYGINTKVGLGDDVYDLSEYVTHSRVFKSIACLPWDNTGTDTLLLPDLFDVQYKKVTIDLRPFGLSDLHHGYVMCPDINIENFIGGKNIFLDITLNRKNNIIDLRKSTSAVIRSNLEEGGHDVIYGFNNNATNRLKLGVIWPIYMEKKWIRINSVMLQKTQIVDHDLPVCRGTRIERYNYDGAMISSIILCDTTPEDLKAKVRTEFIDEFKQFIDDNNTFFGDLPKELLNDFSHAFKNSILFTFLMSITEESLLRYGCAKNQIDLIKNAIIMPILALLNGNLITSILSTGAVSILKYFNFSDYTCMAIGSLVYKGGQLGEMLTPSGFAKFCATSAGSLCGSTLTLFAKNKVKEYFSLQQPANILR
jgi:hypothetical protein